MSNTYCDGFAATVTDCSLNQSASQGFIECNLRLRPSRPADISSFPATSRAGFTCSCPELPVGDVPVELHSRRRCTSRSAPRRYRRALPWPPSGLEAPPP
ncbi:unnamed protein product [Prorocentrum cordatum]|uniref:Uncharacterized protein n=1 Tax=Prorocentrum cordatum TaxID=2364126 RepID=A0ABN9S6D8_9DINO|nr:unnamed protein product [Polarella glacialis]